MSNEDILHKGNISYGPPLERDSAQTDIEGLKLANTSHLIQSSEKYSLRISKLYRKEQTTGVTTQIGSAVKPRQTPSSFIHKSNSFLNPNSSNNASDANISRDKIASPTSVSDFSRLKTKISSKPAFASPVLPKRTPKKKTYKAYSK